MDIAFASLLQKSSGQEGWTSDEHKGPAYSGGQVHWAEPWLVEQLPPFRQGLGSQGSVITEKGDKN